MLVFLALLLCGRPCEAVESAQYRLLLNRAEQYKQQKNWAAMEQSLTEALRFGRGDEYAWRSLSWAQSRQGKGRESLATARENIRRNGAGAWSMTQLCDAAIAEGDIELAKEALRKALAFEPDTGCRESLDTLRIRLSARRYRVIWSIAGMNETELITGLPTPALEYQRAECRALHARRMEYTILGDNQAARVWADGTGSLALQGEITITPCSMKHRLYAGTWAARSPKLAPHLMQGTHGLDPAGTRAVALARTCMRANPFLTVGSINAWFNANIRWHESSGCDPTEDTLARGYGNCADIARSFTAVCRAAGIPSRPVRGQHVDDIHRAAGRLIGHSWVEISIGDAGWAPVEPCDLESVGRIDTTKIRFFHYGFEGEAPLFRLGNLEAEKSLFHLVESRL